MKEARDFNFDDEDDDDDEDEDLKLAFLLSSNELAVLRNFRVRCIDSLSTDFQKSTFNSTCTSDSKISNMFHQDSKLRVAAWYTYLSIRKQFTDSSILKYPTIEGLQIYIIVYI